MGKISEQYGEKESVQYLEGGGEQLLANFGEAITQRITDIGNDVKAAGQSGVRTEVINGVRFDFYKTNWEDVEKVYGYGKTAEDANVWRSNFLGQVDRGTILNRRGKTIDDKKAPTI
jgi:hypothetical protein